MERSLGQIKSKAYLIITGAFIIGVVTGILLMNLVMTKSPPLQTQKLPLIDELTTELKLSAEQKRQVDEIYKESRQRGKDIAKIIQPQLDELRGQTRAKVKAILTPNQQAQYANWCTQRETVRVKSEGKK